MKNEVVSIGSITTPELGRVWVAVSDQGLTTVEFAVGRPAFEALVRRLLRREVKDASGQVLEMAEAATLQIADYLRGTRQVFDIPIDWSALSSDFQRLVLRAVNAIPYGEIRTYGQIAASVGYPKAPRAVGRANATNPMPLVIPCHRVIGSDGKLHGYGGYGGLKTKQWLLEHEAPTAMHRTAAT